MATTKLGIYNFTLGSNGASIFSASTTTADALYPASNLLLPDRYSVYRNATAASTVTIAFNLGSVRTFSAIALLGASYIGGSPAIPRALIEASSDGTTWVSITPLANLPGGNQVFLPNSGTVSYQYVRIQHTQASSYKVLQLGSVWVGALSDLGVVASPPLASTMRRSRMRGETISGLPVVIETGARVATKHTLTLSMVPSSVWQTLQLLPFLGVPFLYIDYRGQPFHVELANDGIDYAVVSYSGSDATTYMDATLELQELP